VDAFKKEPVFPTVWRLGKASVLAAMAVLAVLRLGPQARAQEEVETFIPKTYPAPPYHDPDPAKYNLKFGNLEARVSADVQVEYNDNINLAAHHGLSDWDFGPDVKVGFVYPISLTQLMQFNVGFGYRWYLKASSLNTFTVAPDSRLDYRLVIHQTVSLSFYDAFQIQNNPTSLPQLAGSTPGLLDYIRIINVIGVLARWQPNPQLSLLAGVSYTVNSSLTGAFTALDYKTYSFTAGAMYKVSTPLTVGILGGYSFTVYDQQIQNNGDSFYLGPVASLKITKTIGLDASLYYTVSDFQHTGSIADTSDFEGLTYAATLRQKLNKWLSQDVKVSHSVGMGVGNDYTTQTVFQYDLTARLNRAITANTSFSYSPFAASGVGGESGDTYVWYVGLNYKVSKDWGAGVAYTLAWKDSSLPGHQYTDDRVTFQVSHLF